MESADHYEVVEFVEALKNVAGTLNLNHDKTHEKIRYLKLIINHPHNLDALQAVTSFVTQQTLNISYCVENESYGVCDYYHSHILLSSLEFKRM